MPILDIPEVLGRIERGEAAEVVPALSHYIELVPSSVTAHILLARAFEAEQQWRSALSAWHEAHFLMPNSPVIIHGIQRCAQAIKETSSHEQASTTLEGPPDRDIVAAPEAERISGSPPSFMDEGTGREEEDFVDVSGRAGPTPAGQQTSDRVEYPDTSEGIPPGPAETDEYTDLDRLIKHLESAKIVPGKEEETYPDPELDEEIDDMVSETLARIFAAQEQYGEAARVYELLAQQHPEQAGEFRKKALEMRSRAEEG